MPESTAGVDGERVAAHPTSWSETYEALRVRDMIFGGIETIAGMSEEHTGGFTVAGMPVVIVRVGRDLYAYA